MKKKLVVYTTGEVYLQTDTIKMGIHQGEVQQEVDVSNKTVAEIENLRKSLENS